MFQGQRRMIGDDTKKSDGTSRLEPIVVLERMIAMKGTLVVPQLKAGHPQGGDVVSDGLGSAGQSKQNVGGCIVAERDRHLQKLSQGHIDASLRILVLKWAIGPGKNKVRSQERDRLVERELSLLYLMKDRKSQRQFEDRLHRRMGLRIDVAIQRHPG